MKWRNLFAGRSTTRLPSGTERKQLLNLFVTRSVLGTQIRACVAGDPISAARRLLADDPVWAHPDARLARQFTYDPLLSRLKVSGGAYFGHV